MQNKGIVSKCNIIIITTILNQKKILIPCNLNTRAVACLSVKHGNLNETAINDNAIWVITIACNFYKTMIKNNKFKWIFKMGNEFVVMYYIVVMTFVMDSSTHGLNIWRTFLRFLCHNRTQVNWGNNQSTCEWCHLYVKYAVCFRSTNFC